MTVVGEVGPQLAPGRAPLTYRRLYQHVEKAGRALRATGMGRSDRVAVVPPNGPEMAVAVLTVAANATSAPVNPAYGDGARRYLEDTAASLLGPGACTHDSASLGRANEKIEQLSL